MLQVQVFCNPLCFLYLDDYGLSIRRLRINSFEESRPNKSCYGFWIIVVFAYIMIIISLEKMNSIVVIFVTISRSIRFIECTTSLYCKSMS